MENYAIGLEPNAFPQDRFICLRVSSTPVDPPPLRGSIRECALQSLYQEFGLMTTLLTALRVLLWEPKDCTT